MILHHKHLSYIGLIYLAKLFATVNCEFFDKQTRIKVFLHCLFIWFNPLYKWSNVQLRSDFWISAFQSHGFLTCKKSVGYLSKVCFLVQSFLAFFIFIIQCLMLRSISQKKFVRLFAFRGFLHSMNLLMPFKV